MQAAQNLLDAVHAVFALPEVERTTDLLPELVGIVGEFLSTDAKPAEYVSIYALPKVSQSCVTAANGDSSSGSSSTPQEKKEGGASSAAAVTSPPADEDKQDETTSSQMEEDE
jgi:hypothetical protein